MGITWADLTEEELCELMCGIPEDEVYYNEIYKDEDEKETTQCHNT